jgi:hypothetical protein
MFHLMTILMQAFLSDSVEMPNELPVLDYYANMDDDTITMVIGSQNTLSKPFMFSS